MISSFRDSATTWLLSRPSSQPINQASLRGLAALSIFLFLTIIFLSFVQYNSLVNLGKLSSAREQFLLHYSSLTLEMETNLYKAHRSTLAALLSISDAEVEQEAESQSTWLNRYWIASESLNALFQASPQHQFFPAQYTQSFNNYKIYSLELIQMIKEGKHKESLEFRTSTVKPSFDRWKAQHDSLILDLLDRCKTMKQSFSLETLFLQRVMVVILLFPVAAVGLSLFILLGVLGIRLNPLASPPSRDLWTR
jgi:hypothetical protein